jgi:hypothetical protein
MIYPFEQEAEVEISAVHLETGPAGGKDTGDEIDWESLNS